MTACTILFKQVCWLYVRACKIFTRSLKGWDVASFILPAACANTDTPPKHTCTHLTKTSLFVCRLAQWHATLDLNQQEQHMLSKHRHMPLCPSSSTTSGHKLTHNALAQLDHIVWGLGLLQAAFFKYTHMTAYLHINCVFFVCLLYMYSTDCYTFRTMYCWLNVLHLQWSDWLMLLSKES